MVAASFGGITGSVNMLGTVISHEAGGRTPFSVLVSSLTILIAVLVLPPLIALIPRVVIAGMLMVFSVQLVDRWTLQLVHKLITRQAAQWRRMALDLFVIALVATAAIALNLVTAVGVGIEVAILSFLFRMSRSVIRRSYRGDVVRSRRTREPRLMEILSADGGRILVLELEGVLFFGTAEDLAERVEAARLEDVAYVILDLNRVSEVDSTGARSCSAHDGSEAGITL
jgi:MFS superfamily sulfate permease-like transporter